MTEDILLKLAIFEIIGTIAFAISGSLVAIKSKFDVFGVIVVGTLTAVGGGLTRDVILGIGTPLIFSELYVLGIASLTSLTVFIFAYIKRKTFDEFSSKTESFNNIFNSIGLATFAVTGVELAFSVYNISSNPFLSITAGVLPGVGGGLLRDIITNNTPYIFTKHFYASASIIGSVIYYYIRIFTNNLIIPSIVGILVILLLRFLATKFRWSLPKVHIDNNKK